MISSMNQMFKPIGLPMQIFQSASHLARALQKPEVSSGVASAIRSMTLSNVTRDTFIEAVSGIPDSPYTGYQALAPRLGDIFKRIITPAVCRSLKEMTYYEAPIALLIKNCPLNPNPGFTPEKDVHSIEKGFIEEYFSLGLMNAMYAKPYHDRLEKQGEVIAQINAVKGYENVASSLGTKVDFKYHAEHIHLRLDEGVHFLSLLCIKGDKNARTGLLPVDTCLKGLPSWVLEGLQKEIFVMQTGPSWPSTKVSRVGAILQPDRFGGFNAQYNHDAQNRLIPKTEEASRVLDYFSNHIEDVESEEVSLEKGDCLIINNSKVFHRREAYEISTTWEDRRWLQRLYMQIDYPAIVKEILRKPSFETHLSC